MKRLVLSASAVALLSGLAMAGTAEAAPYKRGYGSISHGERVAIANSQRRVAALKRQAWSNGKLNVWERMRINAAEARHARLVRSARSD